MAFLILCLADAQDGSQDQGAVEAALKGAFLNYEDLPSGLPWQETDVRFNKHPGGFFYANQFWEANIKSEPSKGSCIDEIYRITVGNEFDFSGRFNTAEDYRNSNLRPVEGAIWRAQPYDGLPGGTLIWYPDSMPKPMYQIYFWKNINYTGYVEFSYLRGVYSKDESDSNCSERQAEAEAFARFECERLAKLVYDRLPGSGKISTSKFGIKGDVLEAGLFAPIPNSKVTITKDGNPILTIMPDSKDGFYYVPVDPGTYGVIASAPGYMSSKGMSEDLVVVGLGVNTTYDLRLLETPPAPNKTSSKLPAGYIPYQGEDAATIVIRNKHICNNGSYDSCGNESGRGCSMGISTAYGLCIVDASISSKEARGKWIPPTRLGDVYCVKMSGVASIDSLRANEHDFSVAPGTYRIVEYVVSEVNLELSRSPCRHWWLKPLRIIELEPGQKTTFENSANE